MKSASDWLPDAATTPVVRLGLNLEGSISIAVR